MVVIRRELPRTSIAGPASGLSHRSHEDPPHRVPSRPSPRPPCFIMPRFFQVFRLRRTTALDADRGVSLLDLNTDRPDEPKELPCHGGGHLLLGLSLG